MLGGYTHGFDARKGFDVSAVFLYCRAGFENEAAAEISARAQQAGIHGFVRARATDGWLVFESPQDELAAWCNAALLWSDVMFIRQYFVVCAHLKDMSPLDRVTPLAAALATGPGVFSDVFLETPDTNEGKELSPLCRALHKPLRSKLQQQGLWRADAPWRAHVCLLSATQAYIGYASIEKSAPWPGGVPRLKFPHAAPSRSTLKLDEALLTFLTDDQTARYLQPGMTAVDLGAAPGGWTWQLVRRHLRVTAVDNGAMDAKLLESCVVQHLREDGFRYQPPRPVDWMVCDMVEQPIRIAQLAARWLAEGWCRYTIFNLKLPMKKRYDETQRCLDLVRTATRDAGLRCHLACKQLYHDREEVTVFASVDRR